MISKKRYEDYHRMYCDERAESLARAPKQQFIWDGIDYTDCIETFDSSCRRLKEVEDILAIRYGITSGSITQQLIELDEKNLFVEDDIVADWHSAYCAYCSWFDDEGMVK